MAGWSCTHLSSIHLEVNVSAPYVFYPFTVVITESTTPYDLVQSHIQQLTHILKEWGENEKKEWLWSKLFVRHVISANIKWNNSFNGKPHLTSVRINNVYYKTHLLCYVMIYDKFIDLPTPPIKYTILSVYLLLSVI